MSDIREAAILLCDELELSMPDDPQEFNAENIWAVYRKLRAALADDGWRDISTLPKDGSWVQVWLEKPMLGSRIHSMRTGNGAVIGSVFAWDAPKPLKWRFLPQPPESA